MTLGWDSPNPCAISRELHHSCNSSIFIGWCPYSPRVSCIHVLSYEDDVNQDNVMHIPMVQFQLDYYMYRGSRACLKCSPSVYSIIWSQLTLAVHCVLNITNNGLGIAVTNNTAEKCVTPSDSVMYLKMECPRTWCITFFTCYSIRNHTAESLCVNFDSPWISLYTYGRGV
jgi:hypothetical protein